MLLEEGAELADFVQEHLLLIHGQLALGKSHVLQLDEGITEAEAELEGELGLGATTDPDVDAT